mgnify:CR=1 FL=1
MGKQSKTKEKVLSGTADANIRFDDLCSLLEHLGFKNNRNKGSHRMYAHGNVPDLVNLQSDKSGKAKPYQVKEARTLITRHKL